MDVLGQHHVGQGVMCSPTHWAYRGDWTHSAVTGEAFLPDRDRETETPGKWFAHCSTDGWNRTEKGCGWDSEPTTFETREEAHEAALAHLAEKIEEVL